jgi:hypothetical protein
MGKLDRWEDHLNLGIPVVPVAARNTVNGATDICRENRHVDVSLFFAWDFVVPDNAVGRRLDLGYTVSFAGP